MAKNIILPFEEFSPTNTSNGRFLSIYELTPNGAVDRSSKIFGNMMGENLLLRADRLYCTFMSGHTARGETTVGGLSYDLYKQVYGNSHPMESWYRPELSSYILKRGWLDSETVESHWSSREHAYIKSAGFFFNKPTLKPYTSIINGIICCIIVPTDMGEEELETLLSPYGGKEDFDTRLLLMQSPTEEPSELIDFIRKSRSFILPSPIFISPKQVLSVLHLIKHKGLGIQSTRVNLENPRHPYFCNADPLQGAISLYSFLCTFWGDLITKRLAPAELVKWISYLKCHWSISSLASEGEKRNPTVHKIDTVRVLTEDTTRKSNGAAHEFICTDSELVLTLRNILSYVDTYRDDLAAAILRAAINTGSRISRVLNSSTYLAKDLKSVVDLVMVNKVRWKGSRKQGEKWLAGWIHVTRCVLSTPSFFKLMLSGEISEHRRKIGKGWGKVGLCLKEIYQKEVILSKGLSKSLREYNFDDPSTRFFARSDNRTSRLAHFYTVFCMFPTDENLRMCVEEWVSAVENITASSRIEDTLTSGVQSCSSGRLLLGFGTKHGINDLNLDLTKSTLCWFQSDFLNAPQRGSCAPKLASENLLEDVYILLCRYSTSQISTKVEIREYVDRILVCIEVLLSLKETVLKIRESYYLNEVLKPYFRASLWTEI